MHAYLDNAATTGVRPEVIAEMLPYFEKHFGNPSSRHDSGQISHEAIEDARQTISSVLNCDPDELIFTSGGTESNTLALIGTCQLATSARRHVVVSAIEHEALLGAVEQLSEMGFTTSLVKPNRDGIVRTEDISAALCPETFLVSLMLVNNEVGTIQPIEEVASLLRSRGILFHTDAIQALGKVELDVKKLGVDLMSLSAHKIHSAKGCGALFLRNGVKLKPLILGGGQERGYRSGTENVPGIVGFGRAVALAASEMEEGGRRVKLLRDKLESRILKLISGTWPATSSDERSAYISNIIFPMVDNNYLLKRLSSAGVEVTSGSACASASLKPSYVLEAMGLPESAARSAIRFSLSGITTEAEIDYAISILVDIVAPFIRVEPRPV